MSYIDLYEVGNRIQHCRKQQGYTQEQLAEEMNVSIQMISNVERGNKAIRIENLIKLCQILNVSTDYILTGKHTTNDITSVCQQISKLSERDRQTISMLVDYFSEK